MEARSRQHVGQRLDVGGEGLAGRYRGRFIGAGDAELARARVDLLRAQTPAHRLHEAARLYRVAFGDEGAAVDTKLAPFGAVACEPHRLGVCGMPALRGAWNGARGLMCLKIACPCGLRSGRRQSVVARQADRAAIRGKFESRGSR